MLEINIKIGSRLEEENTAEKMQHALSDSLHGNHCRLPQNRSLTTDELTNKYINKDGLANIYFMHTCIHIYNPGVS